jgi:endonuclease/exonuclease/phosphatase (EEP) superfamily protein YafD
MTGATCRLPAWVVRGVTVAARLLAWGVVGVLAATALTRAVHLDRWWPVVYLIAVSPWLYALAVVVAPAALVARRWSLGAVAGILAVIGLITVGPTMWPFATAQSPPAGSFTLRVFDANVRYNNPSLAGIAAEIIADHPDLVMLDELTPTGAATLQAAGAVSRFRWHYVVPDAGGADGFGVWSDLPLRDPAVWRAGDHPEVSAALVLPDQQTVTIDAIHTTAPRSGVVGEWRTELAAIKARVSAQPQPVLVAGDFNATSQMYELTSITHLGLKDAAIESGKGWQMTWSRLPPVIPPLVRIDHVLYSRGLTVTGYRLGTGKGSDHRPVITEISVFPPGVRRTRS